MVRVLIGLGILGAVRSCVIAGRLLVARVVGADAACVVVLASCV